MSVPSLMSETPGKIGDMMHELIALLVRWQQPPKIKEPIWSVTLQRFSVADIIPLCDLVSATLEYRGSARIRAYNLC